MDCDHPRAWSLLTRLSVIHVTCVNLSKVGNLDQSEAYEIGPYIATCTRIRVLLDHYVQSFINRIINLCVIFMYCNHVFIRNFFELDKQKVNIFILK